ncbi:DUF2272 domain-containing protein [Roseomonas sp. BN140053]|uniref:DUF2272 domain-containing protein n=1 Tax=Roseomonas sp. BN140053 TaxID=3391898 RepID=UPI0039EAB145
MMLSDFEAKLVGVAEGEFRSFNGIHEADEPLASRIPLYWEAVGQPFPGVDTPWSAVFVSWCLKQAGAKTSEFLFAAAHSRFVHWAINNAETNRGLFRAFPFREVSPAVGDLVQWNQPGNTFDFAHAEAHAQYPSHSAIVVATGQDASGRFVQTIGGNEGDSVRRTRIQLDHTGLIAERKRQSFISVVQTLK